MSDSTIPRVGDMVVFQGRKYEVWKVTRMHVGLKDPVRPPMFDKHPVSGVLQEVAHLAARIDALG